MTRVWRPFSEKIRALPSGRHRVQWNKKGPVKALDLAWAEGSLVASALALQFCQRLRLRYPVAQE